MDKKKKPRMAKRKIKSSESRPSKSYLLKSSDESEKTLKTTDTEDDQSDYSTDLNSSSESVETDNLGSSLKGRKEDQPVIFKLAIRENNQ